MSFISFSYIEHFYSIKKVFVTEEQKTPMIWTSIDGQNPGEKSASSNDCPTSSGRDGAGQIAKAARSQRSGRKRTTDTHRISKQNDFAEASQQRYALSFCHEHTRRN
jgi:hypothetical protein